MIALAAHGETLKHLHFLLKVVLPMLAVGLLLSAVLVWVSSVLTMMTAQGRVLEAGLVGVTGRFGGGKSYLLAVVGWWAHKRGRVVYANFSLKGALLFRSWDDLVGLPDGCVVLLDEAHLWWASSDHNAPIEVKSWITQLRHRKITVLWASQHVDMVASWFRKLSQGVWECKKSGSRFLYELHDFTRSGVVGRHVDARFKVRRRRKVMRSYDTYEIVASSREWGAGELDPGASEPPGLSSGGDPESERDTFDEAESSTTT